MNRRILNIVAMAVMLMALLAGGCAEEGFIGEDRQSGDLIISVSLGHPEIAGRDLAATRGSFDNFDNEADKWGTEGENMSSLRIIIIDGSGEVEHNHHVTADNATMLGEYRFKVKNNDRKTIIFISNEENYSVDEEGMEIAGGVQSLATFLATRCAKGEKPDMERLWKFTIALEHNSENDLKMSFAKPLPITAIYTEDFSLPEGTEEMEKTYFLHRAAVKYSFRIVNESSRPHKLECIRINGITDREFLIPDAVYAENFDVESYKTPSTASRSEYRRTLATPLELPAQMAQGVLAIPSFYVPEGIAGEQPQKVSISLDGTDLSDWKDLEWRIPGVEGTTASPMVNLPRNSHVVVNIRITDPGIEVIADLQPYALAEVDPWFGLDRDPEGNVITSRNPDGSYNVLIDGKQVWKDADGEVIIKKFTDGSLFCIAEVKKDYIHDNDETDYEYPYEKDYSGGNMIIIRQKSSGGTYHGTGDSEENHDHGLDDRAKFVLGADNEFYRCDWTNLDEEGHPALDRYDEDGALIIQCNGYQFRIVVGPDGVTDENILSMQKYAGTYLVLTDPNDPSSEELRYYRERYTKEQKGLTLDIALGMGDPEFQAKYPGVYDTGTQRTGKPGKNARSGRDASTFMRRMNARAIRCLGR